MTDGIMDCRPFDPAVWMSERNGFPLSRVDNAGFMLGTLGTCYGRGTEAWQGMLLLSLAGGGWINTYYGNLALLDESQTRWFAKVQAMFLPLQARGQCCTFGGIGRPERAVRLYGTERGQRPGYRGESIAGHCRGRLACSGSHAAVVSGCRLRSDVERQCHHARSRATGVDRCGLVCRCDVRSGRAGGRYHPARCSSTRGNLY